MIVQLIYMWEKNEPEIHLQQSLSIEVNCDVLRHLFIASEKEDPVVMLNTAQLAFSNNC